MKQKNYKKIFFLAFLLFGVLLQLITISINTALNHLNTQEQIKESFKSEKLDKTRLLKSIYFQSKNSIQSIIDNDMFKNFVLKNKNKTSVQSLFAFALNENSSYMQLRFIGTDGKEILRLDKENDKIVIPKILQDKSKRYYFQEILKQDDDYFWNSPIDLNVENGTIQIPYNPTFRVAKKVVYNEKTKGFIIINIKLENILKALVNSANFDICLVDEDGAVIYAQDQEKSWSNQLKKPYNFFKLHNIDKTKILKTDLAKQGIFIEDLSQNLQLTTKNYLIFKNKDIAFLNIKKNNYYVSLYAIIIVFLCSVLLAFVMAKIPTSLYKRLQTEFFKNKKFSAIIDQYVMTISANKDTNITHVSSAFLKKTTYKQDEILGKKHHELITNPDAYNKYTLKNGEMLLKNKDGDYLWIEQSVTTTMSSDEKRYTSILFDITDRKKLKEKLLIDDLTEISNRKYLDQTLQKQISLSKRYSVPFCIFLLEIENLQQINKDYGEIASDKILKQLSEVLKQNIRLSDTIGRFDTQRFLIMMLYADTQNTMVIVNILKRKIKECQFYEKIDVKVKFGISSFAEDDDAQSLIQRAKDTLLDTLQK